MGSWGVGPFENDVGADLRVVWDDYVTKEIGKWSEEDVLTFFRKVYYRGSLPNVSDGTSDELIALCQLFDDNSLKLPVELKEKLVLSLQLELQKDRVSEWGDEKRKRSNAIKKIAKRHKIELTTEKSPKEESKYIEEINLLKNWFENIDRVNSLRQSMTAKNIDWMEGIKPKYVQSLEDQTWQFSDDDDEDNAAVLSELRYLAVVWFVFFNLEYKSEEIDLVLGKARHIT